MSTGVKHCIYCLHQFKKGYINSEKYLNIFPVDNPTDDEEENIKLSIQATDEANREQEGPSSILVDPLVVVQPHRANNTR